VSSQEDAGPTLQIQRADTRLLRHQTASEAVDSLRILVITVDRNAAPPGGKPAVHVRSKLQIATVIFLNTESLGSKFGGE
jgi:hypothetical protein